MQRPKKQANNWLPSFPAVALRLLELFADEEVAIMQLTNEIRHDPALTARILQIANSPLFRSKREITTLEHAVSWLGKSEIVGLVLSQKMASYSVEFGRSARYCREFWLQSFVQGCAMTRIAESSGKIMPGEAYVCGLLLDFGKLMILHNHQEKYADVLNESRHPGVSLVELEQVRLGLNHAEVGEELLKEMGLPERFAKVAGKHATPFSRISQLSRDPWHEMTIAAIASSAVGDFFCGVNQGEALATFEMVGRVHLGMSGADLDWILETVQSDISQKAHLYSIDRHQILPIGQLVGHANSQLERMNWRLDGDNDEAGSEASANEELMEENRILRNLVAHLEEKACRDGLTGLYNRDYFNGRLLECINHSVMTRNPFGVAVIDLDDFKLINDEYGHLAGDVAITRTARLIETCLPGALIARMGGDEFVALLPIEDMKQLMEVLNGLCTSIRSNGLDSIKTMTLSVGGVYCQNIQDANESLPIQIFNLADKAMYQAKKSGGNSSVVVIYDEATSSAGSNAPVTSQGTNSAFPMPAAGSS
jgi:two-component system, cell cycle response regulator